MQLCHGEHNTLRRSSHPRRVASHQSYPILMDAQQNRLPHKHLDDPGGVFYDEASHSHVTHLHRNQQTNHSMAHQLQIPHPTDYFHITMYHKHSVFSNTWSTSPGPFLLRPQLEQPIKKAAAKPAVKKTKTPPKTKRNLARIKLPINDLCSTKTAPQMRQASRRIIAPPSVQHEKVPTTRKRFRRKAVKILGPNTELRKRILAVINGTAVVAREFQLPSASAMTTNKSPFYSKTHHALMQRFSRDKAENYYHH